MWGYLDQHDGNDDLVEKHELRGTDNSIGRTSEFCDVVIDKPFVSRKQCRLIRQEGRVVKLVHYSDNCQTLVNDVQVSKSDDKVQLPSGRVGHMLIVSTF